MANKTSTGDDADASAVRAGDAALKTKVKFGLGPRSKKHRRPRGVHPLLWIRIRIQNRLDIRTKFFSAGRDVKQCPRYYGFMKDALRGWRSRRWYGPPSRPAAFRAINLPAIHLTASLWRPCISRRDISSRRWRHAWSWRSWNNLVGKPRVGRPSFRVSADHSKKVLEISSATRSSTLCHHVFL